MGTVAMRLPRHPALVALGYRPEREKWDALAAAAALVMPSPHESFSFVILEAWSQGTPVLATARSPVLRGHVERARAGLLYDVEPGDFPRRVDSLLADDALRKVLGERGRAYVEARYRWPRITQQYLAFLDRMFGGGGEPTRPGYPAEGSPPDGARRVRAELRSRGTALVVPVEAGARDVAPPPPRSGHRSHSRRRLRHGRHAPRPRPRTVCGTRATSPPAPVGGSRREDHRRDGTSPTGRRPSNQPEARGGPATSRPPCWPSGSMPSRWRSPSARGGV